jgi:site-specific recombinase XerD
MNIAASNPCDALERPRTVQSVARGLSAEEVRRLLAIVPSTVAGRRDRALLLVFVLTGRRRAEVIGLTAGDIARDHECHLLQPVPALPSGGHEPDLRRSSPHR